MITGERILKITGDRKKFEPIKNFKINVDIKDVKVKGEDIELEYYYSVEYETGVGNLEITGILFAKEDKKLTKEIADTWKKDKKLPENYIGNIMRTIIYTGSANGTLLARVMNFSAPFVPPNIRVGEKE